MVGNFKVEPETVSSAELPNGKSVMENSRPLTDGDYFDPTAVLSEPVPPVAVDGGDVLEVKVNGEKEPKRQIVLHTTCLAVTEPDADDESTGDKEAYMASVLARCRRTLVERTKL